MMADMKRWYLLYTKPRQELIALANLLNQAYVAYAPQIEIRKRTNQGWRQVRESLFPNYVFIQLDDTQDNWKPIRSTKGVNGFVRFGSGMPAHVPDTIMAQLLAINIDQLQAELTHYPKAGDRVMVSVGDAWLDALVQSDDGKGRVAVLLSLLGQEQSLWVEATAVRAAAT